MELYLFKINRELMDLGAMEFDSSLADIFKRLQRDKNVITFVGKKGETKAFSINWREGILEGRGIKSFFNNYDAECLLIQVREDGMLELISPPAAKENPIGAAVPEAERTQAVLSAMNAYYNSNKSWFRLLHSAREFSVDASDDRLLCLPHLRDMDIYNYQVKTVKAVINRFRGRVLFCDEVGLGKTVEAGMAMLEYIMRGLVKKILILVPPSLVDQWYFEMKRKFNQDFIRFDDPEFKNMGDKAWSHYSKIIASISTAKRKSNSDVISGIQYDLIIVDEAHHLKNRNTQTWKFINSLKKKYIYLLTATPVQNNLEELYNLITLLKPGQLKTYSYFKKTFVGDREGMEAKNTTQLRQLLSSVMIRNKRSDVDIKFTRRFASTVSINLSPGEQKIYDDISTFIKKRYNDEYEGLTRFVLKNLQEEMGSSFLAMSRTLEALSNNSRLGTEDRNMLMGFLQSTRDILKTESGVNVKLLHLLKILKEFDGKMLIFTKYKATQEFITSFLRKEGFLVAEFHGGLKRKEKEEQINMFKERANVLVSTEAGGEGRNLQFCNGMINFDLPWNPMSIEQRIGRIHRVGQTKDVYVYNLAAKNTVEHYILELLDKKINMFELVIGEVDMILGEIEENEEFSDIIMNAWTRSQTLSEVEVEIERIGEKLIENKKQYARIKELDETLFGNSFEYGKQGV